jgi:nitrogen PTS system EIIA component
MRGRRFFLAQRLCLAVREKGKRVTLTGGKSVASASLLPFAVSRVLSNVSPNSRRSVIDYIGRQAATDIGLHAVGVVDAIIKAETTISAGIGDGVAVLDCMMEHLDAPYTLVARLVNQVDFLAPDGKPVDLVCLILSPASDRIGHIRSLGRLTRLMHWDDFRQKLRSANSADAMTALFMMPSLEMLAA